MSFLPCAASILCLVLKAWSTKLIIASHSYLKVTKMTKITGDNKQIDQLVVRLRDLKDEISWEIGCLKPSDVQSRGAFDAKQLQYVINELAKVVAELKILDAAKGKNKHL